MPWATTLETRGTQHLLDGGTIAVRLIEKRLHAIHLMCMAKDRHPTDQLLLLPQSTPIDKMQRRCRLIGGIVQSTRADDTFEPLTDEQVMHYVKQQ